MTDSNSRAPKPRIVIVGAGLGGSLLSDALAGEFDVTVVELGAGAPPLQDRIVDVGAPAVTSPHICSGFGGTTNLWHNGLIEIDEEVFAARWPFPKKTLERHYDEAFRKLSGQPRSKVAAAAAQLLKRYLDADFPAAAFGAWLYYPKRRVNPWISLRLKERVAAVAGEALRFDCDPSGVVRSVLVREAGSGSLREVTGDVFVVAGGGLGTPKLLEELRLIRSCIPDFVGHHYEDHPCALVGEVVLDQPLYRLWNFPCYGGNLRLPLMLSEDGLAVSFQLRPVAHALIVNPSKRVKGVISDLRNNPFDLSLYFRFLAHWDDIMEVLSFKFNLNLPTRHYSLLMVAEQPPSMGAAVWAEAHRGRICRKWTISNSDLETYNKAIGRVLGLLGRRVVSSKIFPDWNSNIYSSSHHSGTARMSRNDRPGVCDADQRVIGTENLYVCDGAVIPGTGIANTGLTIAALALRLGEHLRGLFRKRGAAGFATERLRDEVSDGV